MKARLTFKEYSEWLKDHWLKDGILVGLYFALATLMFSSKLDTLGILSRYRRRAKAAGVDNR